MQYQFKKNPQMISRHCQKQQIFLLPKPLRIFMTSAKESAY